MRIVRTRSIPNVDNERLTTDLDRIHQLYHTQAGLQAHDGPRRELIDMGRKGIKIHTELVTRGVTASDCQFCNTNLQSR